MRFAPIHIRAAIATVLAIGACPLPMSMAAEIPPEQLEFFETQIRPLLAERCFECHSAGKKQKGGLVLDSRQGWMAGGETGPALVPGDPEASLIIKAIGYENPDLQMPPKKRLSKTEIEAIHKWIAMGAPDPREGSAPNAAPANDFDLQKRASEHWAWQKRGTPKVPAVANQDWPRGDIDRFILRKLEDAGIKPAAAADRRVLVRRLYFDLIGLPPTAEEIDAFLADDSPNSYQKLVDALLGSPHFGEKWGQHWLDLVRYAETRGHEADHAIPEAWKYRDYVIRAFNADVPYDQLLIEHIAGDLVEEPRVDPQRRTNESIQGTGFWHLGEATHSPVDIREDECTRVANQIDVFSKAFLSLTVGCARCHDHKFDAIATRDYYSMFGYLQSSSFHLADISDPVAQRKAATQLAKLGVQSQPEILAALSKEFTAGKGAFVKSLEAARPALRTMLRRKGKQIVFVEAEVSKLAEEHGVDLERLKQLALELYGLRDNRQHLLYPLAGYAQEATPQQSAKKVLAAWQALADETARKSGELEVLRSDAKGEGNYVKTKRKFDPAVDVIADYGDLAPSDWITTGYRFGSAPAKPGALKISGDANNPSVQMLAEAAARSDLTSGKFSGMLRTKTFEITADRIWLRYSGNADLFMAVDSHRVCQGPLHSGRLRKDLKGGGSEFRWEAYDVHKYVGHRAHLEFTPKGDFALSRVQFGDNQPGDPFRPDPALQVLVADAPDKLPTTLADAIESAFRRVLTGADPNDPAFGIVAQAIGFRDLWKTRDSSVDTRLAKFLAAKGPIEAGIPGAERALALVDGSAETEPVHIRGNYRTLEKNGVPRTFLTALVGEEAEAPAARGSGRLQLAQQVASPDNPLTARVITNRLWHYLFGRGIVPSVDNFGSTGQPPSNLELLDHLANDFVANGWSIQHTIREIVLSSTYQQSSQPDAAKSTVDPTNILLHRMPIRRLTAESIRDSLLAVSGRLDRKQFGPSVMVHITPFMRNNRSPGGSGPLDGNGRRSIYVEGRRNHLEPLLLAFDKPTPFTAIGLRNVSNSPAQPLIMLNNPLVHAQAKLWAKKLLAKQMTDSQRIDHAYVSAFGRPPEKWERDGALGFLTILAQQHGEAKPGEASWSDLAHTLFNVKEFIYVN